MAEPRQQNSLALVSLIAGIASWTGLACIGPIVAIVAGHMARREIRASGGAQEGDGMAVAGLVLGYVHLALSIVIGILVVLIIVGAIGFGLWSQGHGFPGLHK